MNNITHGLQRILKKIRLHELLENGLEFNGGSGVLDGFKKDADGGDGMHVGMRIIYMEME